MNKETLSRREVTQYQKDYISERTIKDSGVITFESYHSEDNRTIVTNVNLGGANFLANRIYTLTNNGKEILKSKDSGAILDKYVEIMINRYNLN